MSTDLQQSCRRALANRLGPCQISLLLVLSTALLTVRAVSQTPGWAGSVGTDLDFAQSRASDLKRPLLLLVAERGASQADDRALALVVGLAAKALRDDAVVLILDLAISRNRATVARFHVTNTPVILCLSPQGIINSRDGGTITRELVLRRVEEAKRQSPELDATLIRLEAAAAEHPNDVAAQFALSDFLIAHRNAFEAIPRLAVIAHSDAYTPADRVTAWVALARAHAWSGEPEKARHEANDLLATLGPTMPSAQAGAKLVLGVLDAAAKRTSLARKELAEAVAAAPESPYGKEAAKILAELPPGHATQ